MLTGVSSEEQIVAVAEQINSPWPSHWIVAVTGWS